MKDADQTIAVVCGDDKAEVIIGALRINLIHTLTTDEYTTRMILTVI
ncbi:MAG: hypothetical protein IJ303_05555 [Clostridia bacterium]|nr:hypothetical protein [Clostridia bacterium]